LVAKGGGYRRFMANLINVLLNKMSFVGAALDADCNYLSSLHYKPGITGIVQQNHAQISSHVPMDTFDLHYLKNQGLLLDIELILRALFATRIK